MAYKEIFYQGLKDLRVSVDDTSVSSPDYFRITKIPSEFTSGINTFQFKCNPDFFLDNSYIYVEVLDFNSKPIYCEYKVDLYSELKEVIVSVFVDDKTASGAGQIYLCGTLKKSVSGDIYNTRSINCRWSKSIQIDSSKRSDSEIVFDELPLVTISSSTGSYQDYIYSGSQQRISNEYDNLDYYFYNNTPVIVTSSLSSRPFNVYAATASFEINSTSCSLIYPEIQLNNSTSTVVLSGSVSSGSIYLKDPIQFTDMSGATVFPSSLQISNCISDEYQRPVSGSLTENKFNIATAYFSNLRPQTGQIAKIKSYYRSSGVGEYILANETDILSSEESRGLNSETLTCSFTIPTVHRNDLMDFKFEFLSPRGLKSSQTLESLSHSFIGANTYVYGDDNLLTGSLFVASKTNTGVQISSKGNASLISSIGYRGIDNALMNTGSAGFMMFSGSVDSIINASRPYYGVGLELVANTSSYFRFTTSGSGLLDIRTNKFFIGNSNTYLSGSDSNLEILNKSGSLTKFHLRSNGNVTASAIIAYTGSLDTERFVQIDTTIGLTDGRNIGRTLYSLPFTTALSDSRSTSGLQFASRSSGQMIDILNSGSITSSYISYTNLIDDQLIYLLPFENAITIFGNSLIEKTSVGTLQSTNPGLTVFYRFSLWSINTGSFSTLGSYDTSSLDNYLGGSSGSFSFSTPTTELGTLRTLLPAAAVNTTVFNTPWKSVIHLNNNAYDRLSVLKMEYAYVCYEQTGNNNPFDFRIKHTNITALSGRTLQTIASTGNNTTIVKGSDPIEPEV